MSFADVEYLPFLVLVVGLYALVPARARAATLLLSSWCFYLWVVPRDGIWLAASTLVDFFVAKRIAATDAPLRRRRWLWVSLACNLGLLATFKYSGFFVTSLGRVSAALGGPSFEHDGFALPLGISFYTFQTLCYTIDVYRGRLQPCRSLVEYALYVSFFPQLVAGPIERGGHLIPQLRALAEIRAENVSVGLRRILFGLAKKWLLADRLLAEVWPAFIRPEGRDGLTLTAAALGMWVVLYLDFSAYTDIARGSARLFGIELVRNFERPFLATSVGDWARRWHTSLTDWMFDYVWAPLSKGRMTAGKLWRANVTVMALFGLWHGARWTFVLWGVGYGVLMSLEHTARLRRIARGRRPARASGPRLLAGWLLTTWIGTQLIVLFFSPSLGAVARFYAAQWTGGLPADPATWAWLGSLAGLLSCLFALHAIGAAFDPGAAWQRLPRPVRFACLALGAWACLELRVAEPRPFVYVAF